jgi:ribose/xylose/arabinose/galactoside ABC-type transport system permease subunit
VSKIARSRSIGSATWRAVSSQPLIPAGLVLIALFGVIEPNFASGSNALNIATQASVLLIAATAMTFVILTAGIDLSVGAMIFLAGALVTSTWLQSLPPALALVLVALCCAVLGGLNGLGVAVVGVPAMIVTLATLQIFRGLGGHITGQRSVIVDDDLRFMGRGDVAGIPLPFVVAIAVILFGTFVLRRTVFGRFVQAIGSNQPAAMNAGLPVKRVLIGVYAFAGLLVGIAAMVQVGRLGAVQPTLGSGFELTVITAVVLGGTSLTGGRGSVIGTMIGALILAIVENGLVLIGASAYIFDIVRGAVLLSALLLSGIPQQLLRRLRADSSSTPQSART